MKWVEVFAGTTKDRGIIIEALYSRNLSEATIKNQLKRLEKYVLIDSASAISSCLAAYEKPCNPVPKQKKI